MNCFKQFSSFLRYERRLNGSDQSSCHGDRGRMLALYMKSVRPEYSSMISISAGIFIFGFASDLSSENYRKYSDSGRISGSQPGLYKNSSADHRHCLYL